MLTFFNHKRRVIAIVVLALSALLLFGIGIGIGQGISNTSAVSSNNTLTQALGSALDAPASDASGPNANKVASDADALAVLAADNNPGQLSAADLNLLRAFQNASRSIAANVIPVVVRIDILRAVNQSSNNPFRNFFLFPNPDGEGEEQPQSQDQGEERLYNGGYGSGIIVDQRDKTVFVLTNNHVVADGTKFTVQTHEGKSYEATVVGKDRNRDLAVISFQSDVKMPLAKLGDSSALRAGDVVYAIGSPYGIVNTITQGIVSATGRNSNDLPGGGGQITSFTDYIQTDAAINPGNSGGALVNLAGEVVGINTWIATRTGENVGLGFSIPVNNARKVAQDLITKGRVEYAWLGLFPTDITDAVRADLKLSTATGALVSNVIGESPAEKSGILPGDFITQVGSTNIRNADELIRTVAALDPSAEFQVRVIRNGQPQTIKVKLGIRPDDTSNMSNWPGFFVAPGSVDLQRAMGLRNPLPADTLVVTNVTEGSNAADAGLRRGDLLLSVQGKAVKNLAEFYAALAGPNTKELEVKVNRNNREVTLRWQK